MSSFGDIPGDPILLAVASIIDGQLVTVVNSRAVYFGGGAMSKWAKSGNRKWRGIDV